MTRTLASPQANVLQGTQDLISAIVPGVSPRQRWRYVPQSIAFEGSGPRAFALVSIEQQPERYIAGAGSIEEHITAIYQVRYVPGDLLDDMIGRDHVDLIEALQPTRTYSSGAWGEMRFRKIEAPTRDEPLENGEVIVQRPITIYYRYNVTLT